MRPPRRRRRRRWNQRNPEHEDTLPRRQEQRTLAPRHRTPLKPVLTLQPPSVTSRRHLTPAHCISPRIQRRWPTASQPPQASHRPRTRPQHPSHRLPLHSLAGIAQQPPVPDTSSPPTYLRPPTVSPTVAHDPRTAKPPVEAWGFRSTATGIRTRLAYVGLRRSSLFPGVSRGSCCAVLKELATDWPPNAASISCASRSPGM